LSEVEFVFFALDLLGHLFDHRLHLALLIKQVLMRGLQRLILRTQVRLCVLVSAPAIFQLRVETRLHFSLL